MGMKKLRCILPLLFLAAVLPKGLCAQELPVRVEDGKEYMVYTVEPGNTLFGISRAYSVSIESLKEANENLGEGLEIGREILIPKAAVNRRAARKSDVKTDGKYLLHTVQRKETLFGIAKSYGVTVNDLAELNPEEVRVLSTGSVLRVPVQRSLSVAQAYLEPARNDTFTVHRAAKGETPYSIAKQYGISTDSLAEANPGILENMAEGAWITVPVYNASFLAERAGAEVGRAVTETEARKQKYRIALMLPFELHHNDSIAESIEAGEDLYILTEIALEFYRGVRVAADSLERLGLQAEITVYDVGEDVVAVKELLKAIDFSELDLVIGPMHKNSLALVSEASQQHGFRLVSPNAFSKEVFRDNPFLFRATATRETMLRYLAHYLALNHAKDNVLMVNSESPRDWPARKMLKKTYNEATASFPNALRDSLASVTKALLNGNGASRLLKKDTLNVLVVPSNELAFVSDMFTVFTALEREGYPLQVYGLDRWIHYDNIDTDYKNRLNLRLVVPNYVDYSAEPVIAFLEEFRERYNSEPSKHAYGFQGYDLAMVFGQYLMQYGLNFTEPAGACDTEGVMGAYRFGQTPDGRDHENKSVLIIGYDDYKIKRIN